MTSLVRFRRRGCLLREPLRRALRLNTLRERAAQFGTSLARPSTLSQEIQGYPRDHHVGLARGVRALGRRAGVVDRDGSRATPKSTLEPEPEDDARGRLGVRAPRRGGDRLERQLRARCVRPTARRARALGEGGRDGFGRGRRHARRRLLRLRARRRQLVVPAGDDERLPERDERRR